jgi:hypothetical protein
MNLIDAMVAYETQHGDTLMSLSTTSPIQVVFLRHGGCTFCREALTEIAARRGDIEDDGTRIVLVHMMPQDEAGELFARYGLDDLPRISDPARQLYNAFDLESGSLKQLLGWKVWWRGFAAGILKRHGAGKLKGDGRQMPGVFVVKDGAIVKAYRHRTAADRPRYEDFTGAACELAGDAESRRWLPA